MRTRKVHRAGFSLIEVLLAVGLLAILGTKVLLVMKEANDVGTKDASEMALEDQVLQVLDRIAYAVMGADRDQLTPDEESPVFSEALTFTVSLGVEEGEVVWSDPEKVGIDEGNAAQVVYIQNPEAVDPQRVVWTNIARPFLEGEFPNGIDDNGNGLVDEKGLVFALQGDMVTIELTLERPLSNGETVVQHGMTRVTIRN